MTPPDLLPFSAFGGDWPAYEDALHDLFLREIALGDLEFRGWRVSCRRHAETRGKWAAFWHLISSGPLEDDREIDLSRCERLPWVRWVIDNADTHPEIDSWENTRKTEANALLWYREEYLVVLSRRQEYWLLKTAYCTEQHRRIEKLRREREAFHRAGGGGQND